MSTMSRLEDFRARHAAQIKELYERSAARWKIPEAQWAGAIYRAAISSGSLGLRSSFPDEISCTLVHPEDFAFALAFRLGCGEAVDNFEAKYKVLLHDLALDITHDESRATNLAETVFQEICGELEEDGRRRSLLQDFDGRVSLVDWLRALLKRRDAGELDSKVPKFYAPTTRSAPANTPCPRHEALAAYRELVELYGVPHRGRQLSSKERAQIRHHLRVCLPCQTRLATVSSVKDRYSGEPQAAARERKRSTVLPLRVMGIAGIVGILAWAAWLTGQPQQFVDRARTTFRTVVGQSREVAKTRSETPINAVSSGVGTASRASEALKRPLTAELSTAKSSQSANGNETHATLPPSVASQSQLPDSGLDTKVVADVSKSEDFALAKGSAVTAKNHQGLGDTPVSGIPNAKRLKKRTPYHIESDRLYTMEQAQSLIQRFRTLGYTATTSPVESDDKTMYQIEVGTYKTADEANAAADDLESSYNATFNSPPH
jgi:hypothetical protein